MNKEIVEFLTNVVDNRSLTVLSECLHSMQFSVEISIMSETEKERMLCLIDLMFSHLRRIDNYVDVSSATVLNN